MAQLNVLGAAVTWRAGYGSSRECEALGPCSVSSGLRSWGSWTSGVVPGFWSSVYVMDGPTSPSESDVFPLASGVDMTLNRLEAED